MKASQSVSRLMSIGVGIAIACLIAACGRSAGDGDQAGSQTPADTDQVIEGEILDDEEPARFTFQGGDMLEDLADFLGISVAQLRADLETPGATQAGVAALYGKSREELRQFLIEQNDENLEQAVRDGRMPQETADELSEAYLQNVDAILDTSGGSAGPILVQPDDGSAPGSGEGPSFQSSP